MRHSRRAMLAVSVTALVLAGGLAVFLLGTPQAPPEVQSASLADAPVASATDQSPLAIEIPGCVCHSEEPAVVRAHAAYRMSECTQCHAEGTPQIGR